MSHLLLRADARRIPMADGSVNCVVTSPPYFGLRNYGDERQVGLEETPDVYTAELVAVFREVRRVLRDDGTAWLNLGDSYNASPPGNKNPMSKSGLNGAQTSESYRNRLIKTQQEDQEGRSLIPGMKPKNLIGIPWRVALALQADGWYLRSDIIWHKPNPMPSSVEDRPTTAHEYLFLLTKRERYRYDADAIREPVTSSGGSCFGKQLQDSGGTGAHGRRLADASERNHPLGRNRRSVWTVPVRPFKGAHFATFPPKLVEPCIKAGCPAGGVVLDPFSGSGTTGVVALALGRRYVGCDLNAGYLAMSRRRIARPHAPFEAPAPAGGLPLFSGQGGDL